MTTNGRIIIEGLNLAELSGAEPAGAALKAQQAAIAEAQRLFGSITAQSIGADPAGAALEAQKAAIAEARRLADTLYPFGHVHFWGLGRRISGSDFYRGRSNTTRFSYFSYQNPSALGDEVFFEFPLRAGDYRIEVVGQKQINAGIGQFFFNEVSLGTLDLYASGNTETSVVYSATVASSGIQKFRSKVTGKNVMATAHFFPLVCVMFFRV
jgi:hypothetical protein